MNEFFVVFRYQRRLRSDAKYHTSNRVERRKYTKVSKVSLETLAVEDV